MHGAASCFFRQCYKTFLGMKYKILEYRKEDDTHKCIDEKGKYWHLDLFTDSSFPEVNYSKDFENLEGEGYREFMKSLVGKTVDAEEIFPYTPSYFVKNGVWANDL